MSKISTLYRDYGQSIWLDYIDRNLLVSGGLKALVAEGLRGVTTNPTIFNKSISNSRDYDNAIHDLLQTGHEVDDETLYYWLTIQDVQVAADILEPVYLSSKGTDGFVSMEVSPHLAYDTAATVKAARHLWQAVDRPNLMVKVPATIPGIPAIERLLVEGINVNVTLLFSVERYKKVIEAYIHALSLHPNPEKVISVASFFISRIDTKVDAALDKIGTPEAKALKGCIALANAKIAYQNFKEITASTQFEEQRERGARPQRPLWASTSTKNPEYSELLYVESLIGPDTVSTLTPDTLEVFQARGELHATLENDLDVARRELEKLNSLGINLAQITDELEEEGVKKFADSFDQLHASLKEKRQAVAQHCTGG